MFNTPNDQSRPGYLKLGWREVGRPATSCARAAGRDLVTIARSRVPAERWSVPIDVGVRHRVVARRGRQLAAPAAVSSTDRSLRTASDERFARWRYGLADLHYRVVDDGDAAIVVRLRRRGAGRELVVADQLGDPDRADRLVSTRSGGAARPTPCAWAARTSAAASCRCHGAGPILTWRAVCDHGPPPLPNWDLRLGDLELF